MATNGTHEYGSSAEHYATDAALPADPNASATSRDLPKDEVGWYFVEQYYTTMSKSPDKLHLFYSKKSQFVYGKEAERSDIVVGRAAIQDRIKNLEFEDCKVRISNVDSQGSEDSIVIQVIGETSNKGEEPKKFVQTFVLARQPSGYFVLNDILRYINEETEEESEETAQTTQIENSVAVAEPEEPAEPEVAPQEPPAKEAETAEPNVADVDQTLEDSSAPATEASALAVEVPVIEAAADAPEPVDDKSESNPDPEKVVEEIAEEEAKKPEEPKDPSPTPAVPAVCPAAPVAAEAERPKEPPKLMTWASRAAAAAGPPRPVVPIPKTATPPAPAQARPPVPTAPQAAPAPAPAAETTPAPAPAKDQGSEWQTAETKRQNRPQSVSGNLTDKDGTMAYIKYVTDKVRDEDLRSTLAGFGELAYFDINRQKNCAFVEFKTQAGYNAAVTANPHTVNGENIIVEQRRPKANAYGGSNYNSTRGGVAGRGRGGFDANRGGQGVGRGGFPQSRGRGGGAPRGRGAPQVGTA